MCQTTAIELPRLKSEDRSAVPDLGLNDVHTVAA